MAKTELIAVAGTDAVNRVADIVFVHGLDGDPRNTWQIEDWEESFWPQLLYNDVPQLGIWSFGYDASSSKWLGSAMPIVDRATNFAAFLRSEGIGSRPLFFVAHSLGGLVVKQMLRSRYDHDHSDPFVLNTKAVFFFATPHTGSPIANYIKWLRLYRPSQLVNELEFANAPLRDINAWYRSSSARLGIESIVFAETQTTKSVLVVDQVSSDPGITGVVVTPLDANHVDICKPGIDDLAYKVIRNRLQEFVREAAEAITVWDTGKLWIDVSCFNKYPDQWEEKSIPRRPNQLMRYDVTRSDGSVQIAPVLPYEQDTRLDRPVWAMDYMWTPFRWLPLTIDLKLLNKGDSKLYLTQVQLQVQESSVDREPLIVVKRGGMFPYIHLQNEGWGEIRSSRIRFALTDGIGQPKFPDNLPLSCEAKWEDGYSEIDLSETFKSLGVDVERVMDHDRDAPLGPFTSGAAYVYCELSMDVEGLGSRVCRFGTDLRIEGPLCGMYGPPTFTYQAKLQTEGRDYMIPVEVSQVIAPDESDRILIQIDADKSSRHRFRLVFLQGHETVGSTPTIDTRMLVPRSVASLLSPPDDGAPSFSP